MVTTLQQRDLTSLGFILQAEEALVTGCGIAVRLRLSPDVRDLLSAVGLEHDNRNKDLAALVIAKHAPVPQRLSDEQHKQIDALRNAPAAQASGTVLEYARAAHHDLQRLYRAAADHSHDPDLQVLAKRHLPSINDLLERAQAGDKHE